MNKPKADKPRLFWFAQPAPPSVLRRGRPDVPATLMDSMHMLRDGGSVLFISQILKDKYEFGDVLLNLATDVFNMEPADPILLDKFCSRDLILMTTRPPIDDDKTYDRRLIYRTGSPLEVILLDTLSEIFLHSARQYIILADRVVDQIRKGQDRSYRAVRFHVHSNAFICDKANCRNPIDLRARGSQEEATIGYLVYLPHIRGRDGGPGLLLAFGLNGTATLLFAHLLYSKFRHVVQDIVGSQCARLLMIKFTPEFDPVSLPATIGSVGIPNVELILDLADFF